MTSLSKQPIDSDRSSAAQISPADTASVLGAQRQLAVNTANRVPATLVAPDPGGTALWENNIGLECFLAC